MEKLKRGDVKPFFDTEQYINEIHENTIIDRMTRQPFKKHMLDKTMAYYPAGEMYTLIDIYAFTDLYIQTVFDGSTTPILKALLGAYYDFVGWNNLERMVYQNETSISNRAKRGSREILEDKKKGDIRTIQYKISDMIEHTNFNKIPQTEDGLMLGIIHKVFNKVNRTFKLIPNLDRHHTFYKKPIKLERTTISRLAAVVDANRLEFLFSFLMSLIPYCKNRGEERFKANFQVLINSTYVFPYHDLSRIDQLISKGIIYDLKHKFSHDKTEEEDEEVDGSKVLQSAID